MNERFQCGDTAALVSYLYDECEPDERDIVAAHLARCAACAADVAALGGTREALVAWAPPEASLGFRITAADAPASPPGTPAGASILRPFDVARAEAVDSARARSARWWNRPLPAWAQAAAAIAIFGAGLAIGTSRAAGVNVPADSEAHAASVAAVPSTAAVSTSDLTAMEQRLRGEITAVRAAAAATPAAAEAHDSDDAVLKRVQTLIAESERRQRSELALRTAQLIRDFDIQRSSDLAQMQKAMGIIERTTGAQARDMDTLARRVGLTIR